MTDLKSLKAKVALLHILIVDDEELIRDGIIAFMSKFCDHVDGAANGEIALKMFNENKHYDFVLTDVRMPKMSGSALIKELRKIDKEVFIAVMTGSPGDVQNLEDTDLFMAKPLGFDEMIGMLETVVEKKDL